MHQSEFTAKEQPTEAFARVESFVSSNPHGVS
ncbi:Uncharacterised protein [Aeromonas salmonicida]|nr:Uncharacterised protein [Aeromonas salmonicida]